MTIIDKRDAAQRAMDFLREKHIKLKRADALELLARLSGAPNWNVLQAAMRAPTESPYAAAAAAEPAPKLPVSLEVPPYTPPGEVVFEGGHPYWYYSRIAAEAPKFCRDIQAEGDSIPDSHQSKFWGDLAHEFETLSRQNDEFLNWIDFKKRNSAPAEVRQAALSWLRTIQRVAEPVVARLDEQIIKNKARRVRPFLSEPHSQLYSGLKLILRSAARQTRNISERENYDMRIVYLGHIEALMSNALAVDEASCADTAWEACRAAHDSAQAALQLKNNVRKLTR